MLTEIHIDNFRCLVNFDLKLDRLNLLLGDNGGGKTAVFEALRRLQGFLGGAINVDAAFPSQDLTRWQQLDVQHFELAMKVGDDVYTYALSIEHDHDRRCRQIKHEDLWMNLKPLFGFEAGTAQLYDDGFKAGPQYLFDPSRSGIAALQGRPDNRLLTRFHQQMGKLVIVSLCPVHMAFESAEEERQLTPLGDNFASWYRYLSQEHQGNILELTQQLRLVLPGFDSFSLREAGEKTRVLKVLFGSGGQAQKAIAYNFDELSDGQRQLIVLYCLLYGIKGEGYSLFLDEPDNYVALREIQPWLTSLQDACGESISQAVLISHHPEIIDYLAGSAGRWFDRPDNGATRVLDKVPPPADGLKTSETIARGWTS
jgi:predicted ATPase